MIYDYDNLEKYHNRTHEDLSEVETDEISKAAAAPRPKRSKQNTPAEPLISYASNEESFETDSGGRDYGFRIF